MNSDVHTKEWSTLVIDKQGEIREVPDRSEAGNARRQTASPPLAGASTSKLSGSSGVLGGKT